MLYCVDMVFENSSKFLCKQRASWLFFLLNNNANSWIIPLFSLNECYMWLNFAADGGDSIIGGGHLD